MHVRLPIPLTLVLVAALLAGCDTGFSGTPFENEPPDTELSVRDSSLVDNLAGADRLKSTVFVSWTGSDPDGFVTAFEMRFFNTDERPGPEEGWTLTTSTDSLILLPIPRGERIADVTFEVRAIDNEALKDPTPAKTVFPIQNAPPTIRLSTFDLPPDTTFTVFTFAWTADDPEGLSNLDRIDVSLNDSTSFVGLPPDVDFATFVADAGDAGQAETDVAVFTGRGFQRTTFRVPGLRLDAENTFYVRSVDATDTTSVLERYTWYVKEPKSEVLYVNDYRKASNPAVQAFHLALLRDYLPPGLNVDTWDLSKPFVTGNTGNAPRSDALPPNADPTLRLTLGLYKYIYWVSTNATNSIQGNNLPFAAGVMDLFFENGGKLMVHTPISLPINPEDNLGNPAILLLPLTDLITFPDTLRPSLRLPTDSGILPAEPAPGLGETLPELRTSAFVINTLPYLTEGSNTIPLLEADYTYLTRQGGRSGPWFGSKVIASISADRRVGLFALPMINDQTSAPLLVGADGDPEAARRAIHLMLESLGFPK